jgi:hypothetical protein
MVGTNFRQFCEALLHPDVQGFQCIVDQLGSTCHDVDTIKYLLYACGNIVGGSCGDSKYAAELVSHNALVYLQPTLVHSDIGVVILSAYSVACIANNADFKELVIQSKVLDLVEEVLQMVPVGKVSDDEIYIDPGDLDSIVHLLSPDNSPPIQMAGLHYLSQFNLGFKPNLELCSHSMQVVKAIRVAAASPNAFVFSAAACILTALGLPIPSYRSSSKLNDSVIHIRDVNRWTIDEVKSVLLLFISVII